MDEFEAWSVYDLKARLDIGNGTLNRAVRLGRLKHVGVKGPRMATMVQLTHVRAWAQKHWTKSVKCLLCAKRVYRDIYCPECLPPWELKKDQRRAERAKEINKRSDITQFTVPLTDDDLANVLDIAKMGDAIFKKQGLAVNDAPKLFRGLGRKSFGAFLNGRIKELTLKQIFTIFDGLGYRVEVQFIKKDVQEDGQE